MSRRVIASLGVLVTVIVVGAFGSRSLAGQAPTAGAPPVKPTEVAKAAVPAKAWTMPHTPDGQPDIQGTWLNFDSTSFEQGPRAPQHDAAERALGIGGPGWGGGNENTTSKRPSMVVDPPNGRVPVLPWAEAKRDYDLAHIQDSWVHMTPWERCITRGVPGGIFPAAYNSAYQIVQGPGSVAILYEMIHEARIIPVDGSPHLPQNIRLWNGDSRGRWEGNTLVVDITNYTDKGAIANNMASARIRNIAQSEALHVVERFTRVSAERIDYEVTITDPKVYTAPWKVAMPLMRDDTYQIYEYACHEGDRGRENTLSGGRTREKAEAAKKASPITTLAAQDAKSPDQVPFDRVCRVCHGPEGRGDAAPRLVPLNRGYEEVLGIVRDGLEMMPPISERRLSDEEVAQIVAYLESLSKP